jgi:hypothetical protein
MSPVSNYQVEHQGDSEVGRRSDTTEMKVVHCSLGNKHELEPGHGNDAEGERETDQRVAWIREQWHDED